jgi:nucleotide-binding universal stress UspA family protein
MLLHIYVLVDKLLKDIKYKNLKTPVVASPKINISYQQSEKAGKVTSKIKKDVKQEKKRIIKDINKILIAIDGSEKAAEALNFALNLGQKINAEIEIFTVAQTLLLPWINPGTIGLSGVTGSPIDPSYLNDYYADERKYRDKIIEEAANDAEKTYPGLKITKKVASGLPVHEIIEEAKNGFDLIVLGSRGHGFIDELVLGSVSKRVVDDSPIPVLVVK